MWQVTPTPLGKAPQTELSQN